MNLLLHIGTEKTGTTTIQNFLSLNRERLRSAGVLVPKSIGETNHRILPAIVNNEDYVDDFFISNGLKDFSKRKKAKQEWETDFIKEVASSLASFCVISSEHLQSRLRHQEEIFRLKCLLGKLFERIDLILYIRSPIATAVSLYSTAIKYGSMGAEVPAPSNYYFGHVVSHAKTIKIWRSVFGEDALKVRIFEKNALLKMDLIEDFIAASGLPALNYEIPLKDRNESLTRSGLEILRRVNRRIPVLNSEGLENKAREGLIGFFETHFSGGEKYCPPQDVIDAYNESFFQSDEWVRRECFPEREFLFENFMASHCQNKISENDYESIAEAISQLWLNRQV